MCGIAGIYQYGRIDGDVSEQLVTEMRETLRHRGPDGEGTWISEDRRGGLGHRRPSILDSSGGAQPLIGNRGEVLVLDGAIYHYACVRRTLAHAGGSLG